MNSTNSSTILEETEWGPVYEWEASDSSGAYCSEESPNGFFCSRTANHDGRHVAWAIESKWVCDVWQQQDRSAIRIELDRMLGL